MKKTGKVAVSLLLLSIFISSCSTKFNEQDDLNYWNGAFVDSATKILTSQKDTVLALAFLDSGLRKSPNPSAYALASREILLANYFYFFTSDNAATSRNIRSALSRFSSPELQNRYPRTYVGLLLFAGQIAYRLNHYPVANNYFFKARKIASALLAPCDRSAFNYNIAMVLYRQHNYSESLNYFGEAFSQQATCDPQTTAIILQQQEILSNMGLCYMHLEDFDSAMIYFNKALAYSEQNRDSLGAITMDKIYGVIYGNQVSIALEEKKLDKAEQLAKKAILLNDREGYEKDYAQGIKLELAEVYRQKNIPGAMYQILLNVDEKSRAGDPWKQVKWLDLTASYHEKTGRQDSALFYFHAYTHLKDSLDKALSKLMEADVNRQLREMEQEVQITGLKNDNHIARIWLWVTVIFVLMAMIIIYLVTQNYWRSKKSLALSLELNEEIRKQKAAREEEARLRHKLIMEAVIKAQEKERAHIGLELHDNVNQVLTTVKLQTEMVMEGMGDSKQVLMRSSRYLQDCINEIRSLSKRLSAPALGKISLEESVKDLIESINDTHKLKVISSIEGFYDEKLRQDVHLGVYRILQEQLNNILKHSGASEVQVELTKNNHYIRMSIADNGKGFRLNGSSNGIGLMNMQTRAENLNGNLIINTKPGEGCRVEVVIPVSN